MKDDLKQKLEEAKQKYPVGTYLRHISNPWLLIKDQEKFQMCGDTGPGNQGILYDDYFVYLKSEWCGVVIPLPGVQTILIDKSFIRLIEIEQTTYTSWFNAYLNINGYRIKTDIITKESIMLIYQITEDQFYNLIKVERL